MPEVLDEPLKEAAWWFRAPNYVWLVKRRSREKKARIADLRPTVTERNVHRDTGEPIVEADLDCSTRNHLSSPARIAANMGESLGRLIPEHALRKACLLNLFRPRGTVGRARINCEHLHARAAPDGVEYRILRGPQTWTVGVEPKHFIAGLKIFKCALEVHFWNHA